MDSHVALTVFAELSRHQATNNYSNTWYSLQLKREMLFLEIRVLPNCKFDSKLTEFFFGKEFINLNSLIGREWTRMGNCETALASWMNVAKIASLPSLLVILTGRLSFNLTVITLKILIRQTLNQNASDTKSTSWFLENRTTSIFQQ